MTPLCGLGIEGSYYSLKCCEASYDASEVCFPLMLFMWSEQFSLILIW